MKRLLLILLLIPLFLSYDGGGCKKTYADTLVKNGNSLLKCGNVLLKNVPPPPPFTPLDIAGCQLWLKADAGITKDGSDYVSNWADQSGNGNDATQGIGTSQPKYYNIAGKEYLNFDGGNDYLINSSLTLSTPITIFIYWRETSTQNKSVWANNSTTNWGGIWTDIPNVLNFYDGVTQYYYSDNLTIPLITTVIFNGNNSYAYENGIIKLNGVNMGTLGINGYMIATYSALSTFLGMDISEIIIYDSALSDTDRQTVESYLKNKYAL